MPSPLGRNASPHGMSVSLAIVVTLPGLPLPPPPPLTVTVTAALGLEVLLARSLASTVTCIRSWPCLDTAYWVTPTLSVDLFQAIVTVLSVTETTWLFVGDVGGVLSAAGCTAANAAGPAVAVSSATAPAVISDHRYLR